MKRTILISALLFWCIGSVNIQGQGNSNKPEKPAPTFSDIPYGPHERHVFDLWLTKEKDGKVTPLVIYIHGGGFRQGNKNTIQAKSIEQFQAAGFSVAAIHYRLSDSGPYPIMMEDAARCLQTIRSRA